jgi:hypothetical protein
MVTATDQSRPRIMPLQNRVMPSGEIISDPSRAARSMGNRGILHDAERRLGRARWRHRAWIVGALSFNGALRSSAERLPSRLCAAFTSAWIAYQQVRHANMNWLLRLGVPVGQTPVPRSGFVLPHVASVSGAGPVGAGFHIARPDQVRGDPKAPWSTAMSLQDRVDTAGSGCFTQSLSAKPLKKVE